MISSTRFELSSDGANVLCIYVPENSNKSRHLRTLPATLPACYLPSLPPRPLLPAAPMPVFTSEFNIDAASPTYKINDLTCLNFLAGKLVQLHYASL